ncbi:phage portal protein [Gottfriedia acidiceleris]|uniref:phage portal protein n=1 Tax=Gottfriedia acidiceleris TaxID=371036 RepID=UPI0030009B63
MALKDVFKINEIKQENRDLKNEVTELRELTMGGVSISSSSSINNVSAVTEESVLRIPTASACLDLITGSIAQMPIYLHKENEDGTITKIVNDKRVFLLNNENESNMSAINFKKQVVKDVVLRGQSVSFIRNSIEAINVGGVIEEITELSELNYLPFKNIQVKLTQHDGVKFTHAEYLLTTYDSNSLNGKSNQTKFTHDKLLRIINNQKDNAFEGEGILVRGKDIFEQAFAEKNYTTGLYNNGAMPKGVLKTAARLTQPVIERLRASWESLYGGSKNSAKTVILEEGMEYTPLSMKPNEMQIFETSKNTNSEICKLFNVPESMITTSANKYGSIEQNQLHFYKHALAPIVATFEQSCDRQLLTEAEKQQGYFFRFDTSELLRTTEGERTDILAKQVDSGIITINEARKAIDKKDYNEDFVKLSTGHALLNPETNQIRVPNIDGGTTNK